MDPASFCLLLSFQTNITFLQKIDAQKCQDCPLLTPIFNGNACVSCPDNQYYNTQYKNCQNCPGGQSPNPTTKLCECPAGLFWTGVQCISCYHPQYFDIDRKKCMNCPVNQIYNIIQQKCDYCPSATPYFDGQSCLPCPANSAFD